MSRSPQLLRPEVLSRREIEGLIADGMSIIIVHGEVLKLDSWLMYHPGGHKVIQHMVGRDASNEMTVLHSAEICAQMSRFRIGRVEGRWQNFVPPIQGGVFRSAGLEDRSDLCAEESVEDSLSRISSELPALVSTGTNDLHERKRGHHSSDSDAHSQMLVTPPACDEQHDQQESEYLASLREREICFDSAKYPALDDLTQDDIIQKHLLLNDRMRDEGLYECNYTAYAWEAARCSALFIAMLLFLRIGWVCTSGAFLGMFWSQLVFSAHDAGHQGITHNFTIDTVIGMIIAAPLGGLSLGWWKRTHNVHHIVTNAPEHDPDNQHLPIFAINHRFLNNIFSTYHERILPYDAMAKFLVPYQAYLYYPVLALGRFNLYVQSWIFLATGQGPRKGQAWWHRWFEIAGNVIFWLWFGYGIVYKSIPTGWQRFAFVMISHMVTLPLHVQFTVSHFAMSTTDLGPNESFAQKMLRTTMDIDCPEWLDFFHGGLQFQAIHHLFPRVPRHNLRRAQKLVQEFCDEVNIPYALYTFVEGNKGVVRSLAEVSRQATVLAECQRTIAQRGDIFRGR